LKKIQGTRSIFTSAVLIQFYFTAGSCHHTVIHRHDHTGAIAICRCHPATCPDIPVTIPEITPLDVNRPRLARALCKALGCQSKIANIKPATLQFGAWSTDSVPALLTIQTDPFVFRAVIAELAVRLHRPFILFAPTSDHLNADCQELLAHAHAGFFPIDSTLTLTEHGALQPSKLPGELFAQFTPQPKEIDQDIATRVIALVTQFDSQTLTVFRLYCIEAMSAAQAARRLRCSKTTVIRRLDEICRKTGVHPKDLRMLSPHLDRIKDALSDSRASHIHRENLLYDHPDP
jgi:predicted DNA-binding protein (UPF0251 family)